ncbi:unnamed protein product [Mesocestoides corti]|uniref:Secreted protein n=1 Tax=Mesocestoides corti TaxID=53468 RepID=A0A0R3UIW1_MESCO|nr:unnamed protein product [Mesocestoides corti]
MPRLVVVVVFNSPLISTLVSVLWQPLNSTWLFSRTRYFCRNIKAPVADASLPLPYADHPSKSGQRPVTRGEIVRSRLQGGGYQGGNNRFRFILAPFSCPLIRHPLAPTFCSFLGLQIHVKLV